MAMPSQYIRTTYTLSGLPTGKRGTEKTLCEMAKFVRAAVALPFFVDHARLIASQAAPHNTRAQANAIFRHVASCLYYINDPIDVEWVQGAQYTAFQSQFGDCDDAAVLIASLCGSIGIVCQFIVCGFDPSDNSYEHVWAQAYIEPSQFDRGGWYDLDPCADPRTGNNVPGYYAKDATNFAIFPIWQSSATGLGDDYSDYSDYGYDGGDYGDGTWDGGGVDWSTVADDTGVSTPFDPAGITGPDIPDFGIPGYSGPIGDADPSGVYTNPLDTTMFTNTDGSVDIYSPDGSIETWDANGNVTSYSTVNPDGSLTYVNLANNTAYTEDPNGNIKSQAQATPAQKAKAQAIQAAAGSGGGGGGFSPGSGGAQKAPAAQTPTNTSLESTVKSWLDKASNAISALTGATPTGLHTVINPATGQPVLVDSTGRIVSSTALGATGAGISTTTLILLALGAYLITKK